LFSFIVGENLKEPKPRKITRPNIEESSLSQEDSGLSNEAVKMDNFEKVRLKPKCRWLKPRKGKEAKETGSDDGNLA
jgi:hypothetical protein